MLRPVDHVRRNRAGAEVETVHGFESRRSARADRRTGQQV